VILAGKLPIEERDSQAFGSEPAKVVQSEIALRRAAVAEDDARVSPRKDEPVHVKNVVRFRPWEGAEVDRRSALARASK